jgi:mRNA-degrading endonuclease RelE of RelBE toxin-antitoxin system
MRERFYTPEASENLTDFGASDADLTRIDDQVALLAEDPELGFRIPIQLLDWPRGLYRYDVGPYKLNYTFTDNEITVISVML